MGRRILLLSGPNLNLLGSREPEIYGHETLTEIVSALTLAASEAGATLSHLQSNAEHDIVDAVHQAKKEAIDFIIINPASLTHTSIALRDAFLSVSIPFLEIHLSNVYAREAFRQTSYLSDIAQGVITGLGSKGYDYALRYALDNEA